MTALDKMCIAVVRYLKLEFEGRKLAFEKSMPLSAQVVTLDVRGDEPSPDALKEFAAKIREIAPNFTTVYEMEIPNGLEHSARWRDAESNISIRGVRVFDVLARPYPEFLNRFDIAVG